MIINKAFKIVVLSTAFLLVLVCLSFAKDRPQGLQRLQA